ncbi:kinase-like protein [Ceratobasidium sp. AG-I]|nr:kinase-like protein [Ceratobasidium sp. AG-I]
MRTFAEEPWSRPPKIILGIDIGTTQSAVAFAYLYPNGPQSLHQVFDWPGQEGQNKVARIPTVVCYDTAGKAMSFGAEALGYQILEQVEDEGWQLARHFKLHLHPNTMKQNHNIKVQPLPTNVDLLTIYTDFMAYLMKHTQRFFESRIIDGHNVWAEHSESMSIVIAHPNGWTIKEQNFLRKAAVAAKYTTHANARAQIRFVREAEASAHFCMYQSNLQSMLKPNVNIVVCDAGGSTVDIDAYCVKATSPMLELEERKAPACVQAGAVFVNSECEKYLAQVLSDLKLDEGDQSDFLKRGIMNFEDTAKKEFHEIDSHHQVELAGHRFSRPEAGIRRGRITLEGTTVRSFFDNCVGEIAATIRQQSENFDPKYILLAGGFGNSPYLRKILETEFSKNSCLVPVPDQISKAVVEGAVIWCANRPSDGIIVSCNLSMAEMFRCLLELGCADLSSRINPDRHSSTFVAGGSFGDIWTSEMDDGMKVAIKCLRFHTIAENGPKGLKRATREIYMWSKAKHPNVHELMGIMMFQERLGMVSMWMDNGNLRDYIRENPSVNRYRLCGQIAAGVSYLHGIDMVHGDIKAINILVSDDGVAKLSDFDHSILSGGTLAFSSTTNVGGGTLRWMAPELLTSIEGGNNPPATRNMQTDVYALGMTMLEVISGKIPYSEYGHDMGVYRAIDRRNAPIRPKELFENSQQEDEIWVILLQCWDHDAAARPSASHVLNSFQNAVGGMVLSS